MKTKDTNSNATPVSGHTPGPWKTAGFTIYAEPEKRNFGGPVREYLRPVCSMEPGETDGPEYLEQSHGADYNERLPGDAEAHANARLIAASPELLEALEHIAEYCQAQANETTDEAALWSQARSFALAAIARATRGGN